MNFFLNAALRLYLALPLREISVNTYLHLSTNRLSDSATYLHKTCVFGILTAPTGSQHTPSQRTKSLTHLQALMASTYDVGSGSGSRLPTAVLVLAGVSTFVAVSVSTLSIVLQLKNYRKPVLQRYLFSVYNVVSLTELVLGW